MESDQPNNLFGAPGSSAASSKKSSIDDIIDHLTADLQSYDGQYILLGQPTTTDVQSIWGPYDSTVSHAESLIPNTYGNSYSQYNASDETTLPSYLQNGSYTGWPTSGFLPYVMNDPNQHILNNGSYSNCQQNGSLLSHEFDMYSPRDNTDFGRHHVIDSLAGNWEPTQNGTYSPFGNIIETQTVQPPPQIIQNPPNGFASTSNGFSNSSNGFQSISNGFPSSSHGFSSSSNVFTNSSNVVQKKRIVAEVRPMRPTYSDVLAKSVTQSPSTSTTNTPAKISTSVSIKKMDCTPPPTKTVKAKKGNGNSNKNTQTILKRQHSSGSEDLMCNIKVTNHEKKYVTNENNSWSSLEDITKFSLYEDSNDVILQRSPLSSLNNKENNRKTTTIPGAGGGRKSKSPQRIRTQPQPETLNNHKLINSEERRQTKKGIHINNNLQWGVSKQVTSSFSNEKKNNKSTVTEVCRKGTNNKSNINHNIESNNEATKVNKNNTKFVSNLTGQRKPPRSTKKRESSRIGLAWRRWRGLSSEYAVLFLRWFLNLLWDVVAMSLHLLLHLLGVIAGCSKSWMYMSKCMLKNVWTNPRKWWQQGRKHKHSSSKKQHPSRQERDNTYNLPYNISLPATGEEAMKRLLACRGKDPYSILGVTKNCPDEVIKKYYKRQAVLVHPDKNGHPGAEEAFKILVHAFELIGEPERRKAYDRCILESHHAEEAWSELNNLLSQLHKKMEYAANTIRCTNCGNRHKRRKLDRPLYAARYCSQCKIHHSAREGDIWAESSMLGCVWRYYACMEGSVYDISDWASCQTDNLKHLKPNTHVVQYRIVVGKHKPSSPPPPSSQSQSQPNCSEPEFDNFLNSMYGHTHCGSTSHDSSVNRNLRKKGKKKKL